MSLLTQAEIFAAFESSDGTWESAGRAVIAAYEKKLREKKPLGAAGQLIDDYVLAKSGLSDETLLYTHQAPENSDAVFIVFDGPPDQESPSFVEVETSSGISVKAGEWKPYGDYWTLGPLFTRPAPSAPEWISVDARLPPSSDECLTLGACMRVNQLIDTGSFKDWKYDKPTHWMPLPAPPMAAARSD